jgi:hypothetical protein
MGMSLAVAIKRLGLRPLNVGPDPAENQGDGKFANKAEAGVRLIEIGWGTIFLDYDNDGRLDLYMAQMVETDGGVGYNPLFHNNGDGTFTNLAEASGAADPGKTIGVSAADYDADGYLDLIIGDYDEGYKLFRNTLGDGDAGGNWFALRLDGATAVNRDAVGAKVFVTDSTGASGATANSPGGNAGWSCLLGSLLPAGKPRQIIPAILTGGQSGLHGQRPSTGRRGRRGRPALAAMSPWPFSLGVVGPTALRPWTRAPDLRRGAAARRHCWTATRAAGGAADARFAGLATTATRR